jgi:hypothetical protein
MTFDETMAPDSPVDARVGTVKGLLKRSMSLKSLKWTSKPRPQVQSAIEEEPPSTDSSAADLRVRRVPVRYTTIDNGDQVDECEPPSPRHIRRMPFTIEIQKPTPSASTSLVVAFEDTDKHVEVTRDEFKTTQIHTDCLKRALEPSIVQECSDVDQDIARIQSYANQVDAKDTQATVDPILGDIEQAWKDRDRYKDLALLYKRKWMALTDPSAQVDQLDE